jgi:hypothetical protein
MEATNMRTRWNVLLALPLAASVFAGCGGSDDAGSRNAADDRTRQQQPITNAPEDPARATVALTGCVQPGTGDGWVLQQVRFQGDKAGTDPQRHTQTSQAHGITEGSWVRLAPGDQDLRSFAGQRVNLSGTITDNGANTIGTAGTPGVATPSGDRSQAASDEHYSEKVKKEAGRIGRESMANGTAAEVRVEQVQGTGERCAGPAQGAK